jgi:hypothetical protein
VDEVAGWWPGPVGATAAALRRLLCDAQISRVIVDGDSQPLDVGRATRTVTPAQRRALRVRDNGCRFPACDRPHSWTDAHHIRHWRNGGGTDLPNLISLCVRHHHTVHDGGWTITTGAGARPGGPGSATAPAAGLSGGWFWFVDPDGVPHPARDPRLEPRLVAALTAALTHARARVRTGAAA